jgi:lipopolysaccharide biosynthesis glycosyltransferase
MVADLDRWRAEHVTTRAVDYLARVGDRVRLFDQDALNATLAGGWQQLDGRWQTHPRTRNSVGQKVHRDPWIVHFSGLLKPWSYRSTESVDRLFFETVDRTAWRGLRWQGGAKALAFRIYDSPVRRVLYPLEVRTGLLLNALMRRLGPRQAAGLGRRST